MNKNDLNETVDVLMKKIRKPALYLELTKSKAENDITNKSYLGGYPYGVERIDIEKIYCNKCNEYMKFIFQFYVPINDDGEKTNELYQVFLCTTCSEDYFRTNCYVRKIKTEKDLIKYDVSESKMDERILGYLKWFPKYHIDVYPGYDYPEVDYISEKYPEIIDELDEISGGEPFETYINYIEWKNTDFKKTAMKYKGNVELILFHDIPRDSEREVMELLFFLDIEQELGIHFGGDSSVLSVFESKKTGELVCKITRIENGEVYTY